MEVTRVGRGVYLCSSESEPGIRHHVDISSLGCLGQCDCKGFRFHRFPRWKIVRKPFDHFRCKHIRRVRNHVLDQILIHLQKTEQKPNKSKSYG